MFEPFWQPSEIKYSSVQVIWLLENLYLLKEGRWPENPLGSYSEVAGHSQKAPFETPIQIIAELEVRLGMAGRDGELAKSFYADCIDEDRLAIIGHLQEWQVRRRIKRAVSYCCGYRRKTLSYIDWQKQRKVKTDNKKEGG